MLARCAVRWRTDFTDAASLALLRAQILLGMMVCAALGLVGVMLSDHKDWTTAHTEAYWCATGFVAVITLVAWRRGARMGDTTFAVVLYSSYGMTGGSLIASDPVVAIPMVALGTMMTTTVAVLFVQRGTTAYAGIGIAFATVTAVAAAVPARQGNATEYLVSALCVVVVGVVMRLVRDFAASALVRSRHLEATDALTGLQNRRGLERAGLEVWRQAARRSAPLSVLVLDLDHFKRINDEQGHAAGDDVLRLLGDLLIGCGRGQQDLVARLGGEEFLVLSMCVPDSVDAFAEQLRRTVETELAPVTVSIGVHTQLPTEDAPWPTALWEMVNQADHALYRAKAAGRNRVATTAEHDRPETAAPCPALPAQRGVPPTGDGEDLLPVGSAAGASAGPGQRGPKAASKEAEGGSTAIRRTNARASGAPTRRSMPASSHSTEIGPP